jgi:hypothetical protein
MGLTPGARVTAVRRSAKKLANLDWQEIEFVLRQFGIEPLSAWSGSITEYEFALMSLESADDGNLAELYDYLTVAEFEGDGITRVEGPWEPHRFRLFMSHVSSNKRLVGDVKAELASYGIDAFVAHEDIEPAKEWVLEIENALASCDAMAAFLTTRFHTSQWCDQEIGYCIGRRVLIVPIRLGVDPYGFIGRYQGLTVYSKEADKIARQLYEVLVKHELTSQPMAEALTAQLENTDSFRSAKDTSALLLDVPSWTPELLRRLEDAIEHNDQVGESFGVPQRIRGLIRRHTSS